MINDEDLDRTDLADLADLAYWRGHDGAIYTLCFKINKILDGRDDGHGIANEPWESTRRRLLELINE
jgi:hypothetical protein